MRETTRQTGGDALAGQLAREGVEVVFAVPGVQLDWAIDGLRKIANRITLVGTRHEQATSYMADGYARASGKVGVCLVVPGPGVLNAMAGLSTAYACNSRVLCIAGDIFSPAAGKNLGLLHEVRDQTGILAAVTKWQGRAGRAEDVPGVISEAFAQLRASGPKPVAVEISHDVLSSVAEVSLQDSDLALNPLVPAPEQIAATAKLLSASRTPAIYVGGGALAANASDALAAFAERIQAPVILGENGRGALSDRHPLALNALEGRAVMPHADLVFVVGSRFVDTAMGRAAWPSDATRYVYVNTDAAVGSAPRRADVFVQGDCRLALEALERAAQQRPPLKMDLDAVRKWAAEQMREIEPQGAWLKALRRAIPDDGILVNELTQVGYFARIAYPVYQPNTFITPGYQGTLGYGFPTALGAALGSNRRMVVSINGDGGFGWNLQELATARKYNIPVAVVVFNDGYFGNVRRMQFDQFGQEYGVALQNPHFDRLASAFEIPYVSADDPAQLEKALREHAGRGGPTLIEARVGAMPSPWHLLRLMPPPFAADRPAPANPLGEPLPPDPAS
jgi:acetolactate synthase I/II/III large subunit